MSHPNLTDHRRVSFLIYRRESPSGLFVTIFYVFLPLTPSLQPYNNIDKDQYG